MNARVNEPTADQCTVHEKVYEDEHHVGYAIWYPQMGGYVGKAVTLLDKEWSERDDGVAIGGCFDVLVWHNGEFPIRGEDGENPVRIHHCDPTQFIQFGEKVAELNELGRKDWGDICDRAEF